jgi:hypothetical protein
MQAVMIGKQADKERNRTMKAIEYRKQAEKRQAETGYNFTGICYKIAERMSSEELIALGEAEGHRRLIKTVQRIETSEGVERQLAQAGARAIAATLIEYAEA